MSKSKNDILKYTSNIYFFDECIIFFDEKKDIYEVVSKERG